MREAGATCSQRRGQGAPGETRAAALSTRPAWTSSEETLRITDGFFHPDCSLCATPAFARERKQQ